MSEKRTSWILKLVDRVTDPIKKIIKNTNGATQAAERLAQKYEKLSQRADHFSGRLTKMAVGVAAFAALTYGSVQFETGMAKANTMAGLGVQQFAALNDQIKDVAGNVPILRDELANGLYETISNGVPEKNWVSFLQDSSKAAVGGLSDIKEVVGVTSTIIKNYGMEWDKAGSIQDKIQNTAKLGKTSFQELGSALPKVTGNAATLGVGLDELLGSFAALTGVSGNTAEVSTQLSAIFTSLVKPTSEATEMAKNMGIQFDSLSIKKAGGVIQFFDQLKTKVTQYSAETGQNSTEIYGKLFSSAEALRAFIPLTSSVSEDFKNKTTQVANSAGVMQSAFETMSATTANKIQLMRNKFGNAMDKIFEATQPFLDLLIVGTTNVLDFVSEFATIYPNATKVAVSIGIAAFATVLFGTVIMFASLKVRMMWIQTQRLGIRLTLLAGRFLELCEVNGNISF